MWSSVSLSTLSLAEVEKSPFSGWPFIEMGSSKPVLLKPMFSLLCYRCFSLIPNSLKTREQSSWSSANSEGWVLSPAPKNNFWFHRLFSTAIIDSTSWTSDVWLFFSFCESTCRCEWRMFIGHVCGGQKTILEVRCKTGLLLTTAHAGLYTQWLAFACVCMCVHVRVSSHRIWKCAPSPTETPRQLSSTNFKVLIRCV